MPPYAEEAHINCGNFQCFGHYAKLFERASCMSEWGMWTYWAMTTEGRKKKPPLHKTTLWLLKNVESHCLVCVSKAAK